MNDCPICLSEMSDEVYILNCTHAFHHACITEWLKCSNNCPLCRTNVDADRKYVLDGIMSEERRLYIENVRATCIWTALGLEWLFPNGLNGYSQTAIEFLDSPEGKEMLNECGKEIPRDIFLRLGVSALQQCAQNMVQNRII